MRAIGTIERAEMAERFVDHLLTCGIEAVTESQGHSATTDWEIWIRDEDQLERAKAELEVFQQNPDAKSFQEASNTARQLRRQRTIEAAQAAGLRRSLPNRAPPSRRMGAISLMLGIVGLIVSLAVDFGTRPLVGGWNTLEMLQWVTPEDYIKSNQNPLASIGRGELWRLFTPAFLHFSAQHLFFNLMALLSFGGVCEMLLTRRNFVMLVLMSHLLGAFLQAFVPEQFQGSPFFGGLSGVVYGLFGFLWMRPWFDSSLPQLLSPFSVLLMTGWLMMTWFPWFPVQNVANWAHLGGLIAGGLGAFFLPFTRPNLSAPSD